MRNHTCTSQGNTERPAGSTLSPTANAWVAAAKHLLCLACPACVSEEATLGVFAVRAAERHTSVDTWQRYRCRCSNLQFGMSGVPLWKGLWSSMVILICQGF